MADVTDRMGEGEEGSGKCTLSIFGHVIVGESPSDFPRSRELEATKNFFLLADDKLIRISLKCKKGAEWKDNFLSI